MAFAQDQLSLLSYSGAGASFSQYAYANTATDTVTATGFFNNAVEELSVGDTIYVLNTGITLRVSANNGTVVTVVANYTAPA